VTSPFDARPIIVALAGPNGAGKSTFFHSYLAASDLYFLNADDLGRELDLDVPDAATLTNSLRQVLVEQRESFIFETIFSDPVGDKVEFLRKAVAHGYTVVLIFIGLDDQELSEQRVAMRVLQGGHDVPSERLAARFPRTMQNLARAIRQLPYVLVFDNSDLANPFRKVAEFRDGKALSLHEPVPAWLPLTEK
jgi:predicted ABC-type ATPase